MKKLLVVLLSLMLVLTACGEKDKKSEDQSSSSETTTEANVENSDSVKTTKVDKSLKDEELLKSILSNGNFEAPENYYMVMEVTMPMPANFGQDMAKIEELQKRIEEGDMSAMEELGGMDFSEEEDNSVELANQTFTTTMCHYNGDVLSENNTLGENRITIFKKDNNTYYEYVEGETEGKKYATMEPMMDMSTKWTFDEVEDSEDDEFEGLIKAEMQTLDGEEVIYMEYDGLDEEDNKVIDKIWFSMDKKFPVKIESVKEDGSVSHSFKALELEVDKNFSKYVEVPKNIEFVEN